MRLFLALATTLAVALPGPASAARLICRGEATGTAGRVSVELLVEDAKAPMGAWSWMPPSDPSSTPGAMIVLSRRYLDIERGELGPVTMLGALNAAPFDPPKVDRAIVGVSSNTVKPIFRRWSMYAQAVDDLKAGRPFKGLPAGAKPAALVGSVPFARQDPDTAPLLDSLADARSVITSVTDETGQVLVSRGLFWLTDRAGAARLTGEAMAAAKAAAAQPAEKCKPPAAPPPPL